MKPIILGLLLPLAAACSRPIPPEIHERLDKVFNAMAMESGWKFVKITHGFGGKELVADILVSGPLEGAESAQEEALRRKLCPNPADDDLWSRLQGYKLSIAAYTHDRKFTVLVDCENPREQAASPGQ